MNPTSQNRVSTSKTESSNVASSAPHQEDTPGTSSDADAKPRVISLQEWKQLAAQFPRHPPSRRGYVESLIERGQLDLALSEANSMCQERALFCDGKLLAAEIHRIQGRIGDARRLLEDAARMFPLEELVVSAVSRFYFLAEMWEDAKK